MAAAVTYGIVVYKGHIARGRLGGNVPAMITKLAADENVQYLGESSAGASFTDRDMAHEIVGMALVWLCSRQVPLALLPFTIYSVFHVATYTKTYLIPTLQPQKPVSPAPGSPSAKPSVKQSPLAEIIGKFVKQYYDTSMSLVAALEMALLFRLIFTALTFSRGSWVLLAIYTCFFRSRYAQSAFVQGAVAHATARVDAAVSHQSTPPQVRQGWEIFKRVVGQVYDITDVRRYLGGYQPAPAKKPQ